MPEITKQRAYNMDLLRIVSSFLIVLLHFSSSYWFSVPIGGYDFIVMTAYNSITRIAVPIFLMLSGCFLLGPEKKITVNGYIIRPVKLLLTTYIWSAFFAFQGFALDFIKTRSFSIEGFKEALSRFINGHYHMWFCFLLVGYYVLLPIARKIAENIKVLGLFLLLWLILGFIIPCCFTWLGLDVVVAYFDKYEFSLIRGYWGYFLLGYFLWKVAIPKLYRYLLYLAGIIALVLTAVLTVVQSVNSFERIESWFSPGAPFILIASCAAFVLFKNISIKPNEKLGKVLVNISSFTFFVYLFHVFILEKMNLFGITTVSFNSLIAVPVLSLATFIVSLLAAWLINKIPFVNKILLYI